MPKPNRKDECELMARLCVIDVHYGTEGSDCATSQDLESPVSGPIDFEVLTITHECC
jgi:hypothetical protein